METAVEERLEGLKKPGGGNNMHSVLEGLILRTVCIYSPNLKKWLEIRSRPFSGSLLLSNTNDPLSTYITQNNSNRFSEVKYFGLWLKIRPVENSELLCLENVDFVSSSFVHSILSFS